MIVVKIFYIILQTGIVFSERVLILHPCYGGSHILTLRRLAEALTEKNHEVTIIRWRDTNSYPPLINSNISEIVLSFNNSDGSIPFVSHDGKIRMDLGTKRMWHQGLNPTLFPVEGYVTVSTSCKELFENEGLISQLRFSNFKVAIVDLIFNECGLALSYKLGLPTVGFWGFNFASGPAIYSTAFNPPSALPQSFSSLGDSMTFLERVVNTFYFLALHSLMQVEFIVTSKMINKYVPDSPHPSQLIANVSGMLINSHPAFDYPRLLPPTYLEVAGMHLRQPKPLPEDLLNFIDSSGDEGVILFSLGFNFHSDYIPRQVFESYFRVFGRLKQKVIVKAEGLPIYVPPNVKIYSFLPQADILAHNKTKLFITHCGVHGIIEAIKNLVPIVGIPIFMDQNDNLVRLVDHGVAEGVDKLASEEDLLKVITKVVGNPRYKENMKILSKKVSAFGDPLEKAVWLIEHIFVTNGAEHLKLSSRHLGLFQYLCLDVIVFLMFLGFISMLLFYKIVAKIINNWKEKNQMTKMKQS